MAALALQAQRRLVSHLDPKQDPKPHAHAVLDVQPLLAVPHSDAAALLLAPQGLLELVVHRLVRLHGSQKGGVEAWRCAVTNPGRGSQKGEGGEAWRCAVVLVW